MRRPAGFTLIEVLVAAALLLVALTLVGGGLSRHLSVLDRLRGSTEAGDLAEEILIREWLRRREGFELPESTPRPGHSGQLALRQVTLNTKPVEGMTLDEAVAEVTWSAGGQSGVHRMATGLASAGQAPSGG